MKSTGKLTDPHIKKKLNKIMKEVLSSQENARKYLFELGMIDELGNITERYSRQYTNAELLNMGYIKNEND